MFFNPALEIIENHCFFNGFRLGALQNHWLFICFSIVFLPPNLAKTIVFSMVFGYETLKNHQCFCSKIIKQSVVFYVRRAKTIVWSMVFALRTLKKPMVFQWFCASGLVIYKGSWHRPFKNQWFFNDFAHPGCYLQGIVASTLEKPIGFSMILRILLFTRLLVFQLFWIEGSWHRPFKNQWFFNDFAHPGFYLQGIVASTLKKTLCLFQLFCASGLLFTRDRGIDP